MNFDSAEINKLVQANELDLAIQITKDQFAQLPSTAFHKVLDINWLPLAEPLAMQLDKFYKSAYRKIKSVKALYCEMNAFTINYDNWYMEFFAYSKSQGSDDFDWLADYDYAKNTALAFTNLEEVQSVYRDYIENKKYHDPTLRKAFEISEFYIILGVQQLFREAMEIAKGDKVKWATIPVYVAAHDYNELTYNVTRV